MGRVPRISKVLLLSAGMVVGLWLGAGPQLRAQQSAPDNTKTNQGDANKGATTADQQKMNTADGFPAADISALLPDNLGGKEIGTQKATKAPEGAATGAGSGAVLGGALGLLAGIGALAIPGVGPFIAAGPIMAALAGVGVGGAVGGFTGALIGLGIPEYEAKRYEGRIQKGGILLSVHCDTSEEIKRAKEIMKSTGGEDISSTGESSSDYPAGEPQVRRTSSGSTS